jgi:hypothetical protein
MRHRRDHGAVTPREAATALSSVASASLTAWHPGFCLPEPDAEGSRDDSGFVVPRRVMQVAHGGLDVGMSHPFLNATDVGLGDHPRAERMPQVVEAERPEARCA